MVYCGVPFCTSEEGLQNSLTVAFHEIPSEPESRDLWLRAILREGTKKGGQWIPGDGFRVCSLHFQADDYNENSQQKLLKTNAVPSIFPEHPSYVQVVSQKRKLLPSTNQNPPAAKKCLELNESQLSGTPLKSSLSNQRRHSLQLTRYAVRPKAKSANDVCLSRSESPEEVCFTGTTAAEKNSLRLPGENGELIVPGFEGSLLGCSSGWIKDEPDEIVLEEEDTNEEFDPQLQSSMEIIFECGDQQHNRDPTVSHADSTVGAKDMLTLFEDTRLSLDGLRNRFEEELTKKNKQIEDLRRQIEELKRKKKDCRFCHLLSNASPEVISFMENLLASMKTHKESPVQVQNNDSQDVLCHSSAELSVQPRLQDRMNESQDLFCHSSAEWNVQPRVTKRMVPLYPGTDVMISEEAKCLALLHANGNPRKLISYTLRALFTKEELSGFSACGQRVNKPFPPNVTSALKMFVLTTCKMDKGLPPLSESEFHKILNSRFGIARRDLKLRESCNVVLL